MLKSKLIDGIIPEPEGGAHADVDKATSLVKAEVLKHLGKLVKIDPEKLVDRRVEKFCEMGVTVKVK